jgi:NAD+ synthase
MNVSAISDHIVSWLTQYAKQAKAKGFVVGVSGGIDSATTSTLCALTGLEVTLLNLPIYQANDQLNRGLNHMNWLSKTFTTIHTHTVQLDATFDAFKAAQVVEGSNPELTQLALANSRARLRMSTLYYTAQCRSALVAGTGNKVEDFGVGFYTKYGDGGVDLSPIADLTKTEVWKLGEYLGVAREIVDAPPTDGLWGDNRSDEDQIGASYPELEWAMGMHEQGKSAEAFEGREREVFETFTKFHRANKHKMDPIPVCPIPQEWR